MRQLVAAVIVAALTFVGGSPVSATLAPMFLTGRVSAAIVGRDTGPLGSVGPSQVVADAETAAYQVGDVAGGVGDMVDPNEAYDPERAARFPDPLHAHVDAYWSDRFAEAGRPYRPPAGVVGFSTAIETGCGLAEAAEETAFYCVLDETIYYTVEFRQVIEENIGDYGWVVVVAHEWGHHVQRQLGYDVAMLPYQSGNVAPIALEQQADCLAGAYTDAAELSGWLDPGDVDEAILMTGLSGDPPGTAIHNPTAHGSGAERVDAFFEGYELGISGCELGISTVGPPAPRIDGRPRSVHAQDRSPRGEIGGQAKGRSRGT